MINLHIFCSQNTCLEGEASALMAFRLMSPTVYDIKICEEYDFKFFHMNGIHQQLIYVMHICMVNDYMQL
jgi:hypothetical protein